jgi:hypothetical protein
MRVEVMPTRLAVERRRVLSAMVVGRAAYAAGITGLFGYEMLLQIDARLIGNASSVRQELL